MEYHKIPGVFKRDPGNVSKVDYGDFIDPTVAALASSEIWFATEKIDGTNIRIEWDGYKVHLAGRTERAIIPGGLLQVLQETWLREGVEEVFEELFGGKPVTIYGEGIGPKIQNGFKYSATPKFVPFDVMVMGKYLSFDNASEILTRLGAEQPLTPTKPSTLWELIREVATRQISPQIKNPDAPNFIPEGLVARTVVPLYDQRGKRVIVKLKDVDLANGG